MSDQSAALTVLLNQGGKVVLPAGIQTIDQGVIVSTSKGLNLSGQSMSTTILECNGSAGFALWFKNVLATQADVGIDISDLTIRDTSGTAGACDSLLRITQFNDFKVSRVNLSNAKGRHYSFGTVTVTQGSTAVQGYGVNWSGNMAPGHLWIAGYPQEVAAITAIDKLTLCTPWQRGSGVKVPYSLDSGGAGLLLEGTSVGGCTQYGTVDDLKGFGNRVGVFCQGRPSGGAGVSAVQFRGGRMGGFGGIRLANSIGAWFGSHSDTCQWDVPVNNVVLGAGIEDGHQHTIINRAENDPPYCPVFPGDGSATQAATKGVLVIGSATGKCFANYIFPQSVYGFGNGVEWNNLAAADLTVDASRSPAFGNINRTVGPL
jgi:hypothetical protein